MQIGKDDPTMKKVFALVLALALALSMAVMTSAAAADDIKAFFAELSGTVSADELKDAVTSVLADLDVPADVDAGDLEDGVAAATADGLIAKLGLEGTDIADKLQEAMSNDFVAFLAGLYTGPPTTTLVVTGDNSSLIAIGAFAALSAAAAAAFVCLKKKEA
jgi:hypothetical protein